MKKIIGRVIGHIGAYLWEKGGFWNESRCYKDLTVMGKLGCKMFRTGIKLTCVTQDDIQNMAGR